MRKIFCTIIFFLALSLFHTHSFYAQISNQNSNLAALKKTFDEWKPATYRGLTMGISTRDDVFRVFGKPEDFSEYEKLEKSSEPNTIIQYFYNDAGEFSGPMIVGINNGSKRVIWIRVRPNKLSKQEAIEYFGNDYVITRYDVEDCIDDEATPIFESPNGSIMLIEYRARGIFFGLKDNGQVDEISYVSEPPGSTASRCAVQKEVRDAIVKAFVELAVELDKEQGIEETYPETFWMEIYNKQKFKFVSREFDLNEDGKNELIVWLPTEELGGTSGYPIIIFTRTENGYKKLWIVEQAWTPIIVLETKTRGWRNIAFQFGGGGVVWHYQTLRFNGKVYDYSKTKKKQPKGRIVIEKDFVQTVFGPMLK